MKTTKKTARTMFHRILAFSMACLLMMLASSYAVLADYDDKTETQIRNQIVQTDAIAYYWQNSRPDFDGVCASYIAHQLAVRGIFFGSTAYAKEWYGVFNNITQTTTGYTVTQYSGTNALENLVAAQGVPVYDIVVTLPGTTSTAAGHAIYIHAILNTNNSTDINDYVLYYSESFINSGVVRTRTLADFKQQNQQGYGIITGATHFSDLPRDYHGINGKIFAFQNNGANAYLRTSSPADGTLLSTAAQSSSDYGQYFRAVYNVANETYTFYSLQRFAADFEPDEEQVIQVLCESNNYVIAVGQTIEMDSKAAVARQQFKINKTTGGYTIEAVDSTGTGLGLYLGLDSSGVPKVCAASNGTRNIWTMYEMGSTTPFVTRTPGDANEDGAIDTRDADAILSYVAKDPNVVINLANADVNRDGKVNNKDGTILMRYLANWEGVQLLSVGPNNSQLATVLADPELKALYEDAELRELLGEDRLLNILADEDRRNLLTDPRLRAVMETIDFSDPTPVVLQ